MINTKTFDWSVKSLDDSGAFELYAAVFNNLDRQGDIIEPGAFRNLDEFVKDGWGALNHQSMSLPVAWIDSATQDAKGLRVRGRFHSTREAQDCRTVVRERMEAGKAVKCSIGYTIDDAAVETRDGKTIRVLKELDVYEFSFVNLPANPEAAVISAKGAGANEKERPVNEDESAGFIAAMKAFLGFVKKSAAADGVPKSGMTRLKAFAEAMHEHGCKTAEHAKAMNEHGKCAKDMAKEMKSFLKAYKMDDDAPAEDDDPAAHGGRADYGRDDEGDEEVDRPRKPRKGRKEEDPEDTADGDPPKGKSLTRDQSDILVFRDQLRHRATAGRAAASCP